MFLGKADLGLAGMRTGLGWPAEKPALKVTDKPVPFMELTWIAWKQFRWRSPLKRNGTESI